MKYVCLGFYDDAKLAAMPQEQAQKKFEECFACDDVLRRGGHWLGGEGSSPAAMRSRCGWRQRGRRQHFASGNTAMR
jgi:hypothetical protein